MMELFYPDFRCRTTADIKDDFFVKNGIKFAVLDIDNTLVTYADKYPTKSAENFLERLEKLNIKYAFLSNNNEERVKTFNEKLGAPFLANAKKPLLLGIKALMENIGAEKNNTVLIGDQVFTDVLTGKRAGIATILVDPIEDKETLFFRFKRALERIALKNYKG